MNCFCFEQKNVSSKDEKQFDKSPGSPLLSLGEVCSDFRHKESFAAGEDSAHHKAADLKEEVKNETLACFEHLPCFYCKSHENFLSEQKPTLMLSSQTSSESQEFKGKQHSSLGLCLVALNSLIFFSSFQTIEIQRQFNKRVKYEVNKKFGSYYLADHQVRELDVKEMHRIRSWFYLFACIVFSFQNLKNFFLLDNKKKKR